MLCPSGLDCGEVLRFFFSAFFLMPFNQSNNTLIWSSSVSHLYLTSFCAIYLISAMLIIAKYKAIYAKNGLFIFPSAMKMLFILIIGGCLNGNIQFGELFLGFFGILPSLALRLKVCLYPSLT